MPDFWDDAIAETKQRQSKRGVLTPDEISQKIYAAAERHGVADHAETLTRLTRQESNFNPRATSKVGAQGLMQLMPETARELGVTDAYDPDQNIDAGVRYWAKQLKATGDPRLASAAYNAGLGNVQKYGGVPPFRETQDYVQRIHGDDPVAVEMKRQQQPKPKPQPLEDFWQQGIAETKSRQQSAKPQPATPGTGGDVVIRQPVTPSVPFPARPRNAFEQVVDEYSADKQAREAQAKKGVAVRDPYAFTVSKQAPSNLQPINKPPRLSVTPRGIQSEQLTSPIAQPQPKPARQPSTPLSRTAVMAVKAAVPALNAIPDAEIENVIGQIAAGATDTVTDVPVGLAVQAANATPLANQGLPEELRKKLRTAPIEGVKSAVQPVRDIVSEQLPIDPNAEGFFNRTLPRAVGSAVPYIGAGIATRGASPLASAMLGTTGAAAQGYEDAQRSGADVDLSVASGAVNSLTGLLESVGMGRWLNSVGGKQALTKRALEVLEEGGQEGLQDWTSNVNAAVVSGYDPERPLSQGVMESTLAGLLIGAGAQGAGLVNANAPNAPIAPESAPRPVTQAADAIPPQQNVPTQIISNESLMQARRAAEQAPPTSAPASPQTAAPSANDDFFGGLQSKLGRVKGQPAQEAKGAVRTEKVAQQEERVAAKQAKLDAVGQLVVDARNVFVDAPDTASEIEALHKLNIRLSEQAGIVSDVAARTAIKDEILQNTQQIETLKKQQKAESQQQQQAKIEAEKQQKAQIARDALAQKQAIRQQRVQEFEQKRAEYQRQKEMEHEQARLAKEEKTRQAQEQKRAQMAERQSHIEAKTNAKQKAREAAEEAALQAWDVIERNPNDFKARQSLDTALTELLRRENDLPFKERESLTQYKTENALELTRLKREQLKAKTKPATVPAGTTGLSSSNAQPSPPTLPSTTQPPPVIQSQRGQASGIPEIQTAPQGREAARQSAESGALPVRGIPVQSTRTSGSPQERIQAETRGIDDELAAFDAAVQERANEQTGRSSRYATTVRPPATGSVGSASPVSRTGVRQESRIPAQNVGRESRAFDDIDLDAGFEQARGGVNERNQDTLQRNLQPAISAQAPAASVSRGTGEVGNNVGQEQEKVNDEKSQETSSGDQSVNVARESDIYRTKGRERESNSITVVRKMGGIRLTQNRGEYKDIEKSHPGIINQRGRGEDEIVTALRSEGFDVSDHPGALAQYLRDYDDTLKIKEQTANEQKTASKWERLSKRGSDALQAIADGDTSRETENTARDEMEVAKFSRGERAAAIQEARAAGEQRAKVKARAARRVAAKDAQGIDQRKALGDFGKAESLMRKQLTDYETGEVRNAVVDHPNWRDALDIPPDADAQAVFDAIAQDWHDKDSASLISHAEWLGTADALREQGYDDLALSVENAIVASNEFQGRLDKFFADEGAQQAIRQIEGLPPHGKSAKEARQLLLQYLKEVGINDTGTNPAQTNLTDHWIKNYTIARVAERKNAGDKGVATVNERASESAGSKSKSAPQDSPTTSDNRSADSAARTVTESRTESAEPQREPVKEPVTPAPSIKWIDGLSESERQSVFAEMRDINKKIEAYYQEARNLTPRGGALGVGAADFDAMMKAEARADVLRAVNQGKTPQEAEAIAKQAAREYVAKHNAKRPKDFNWQRWEGTADSTIESTARQLAQAAVRAKDSGLKAAKESDIPTPDTAPTQENRYREERFKDTTGAEYEITGGGDIKLFGIARKQPNERKFKTLSATFKSFDAALNFAKGLAKQDNQATLITADTPTPDTAPRSKRETPASLSDTAAREQYDKAVAELRRGKNENGKPFTASKRKTLVDTVRDMGRKLGLPETIEDGGFTTSFLGTGAFAKFNEADLGTIAKHFVQHSKDYAAWAKAMIKDFGQTVRQQLRAIWDGLKAFTKDERGTLNEQRVVELIQKGLEKTGIAEKKKTREDIENSPEFKRWFGESVATVDGKPGSAPQMMYHATSKKFDSFKPSGYRGGASFFSTVPDKAVEAAQASARELIGSAPNQIIPVYISAQKLYGRNYSLPKGVPDITGIRATAETVDALERKVREAISTARFSEDERVNSFAKKLALDEWRRFHQFEENKDGMSGQFVRTERAMEYRGGKVMDVGDASMAWEVFERGPSYSDHGGVGAKAIQALGYDSALIADEGAGKGAQTIAVFSPTQIKSVFNRGTFDPTNPNISAMGFGAFQKFFEKKSPRSPSNIGIAKKAGRIAKKLLFETKVDKNFNPEEWLTEVIHRARIKFDKSSGLSLSKSQQEQFNADVDAVIDGFESGNYQSAQEAKSRIDKMVQDTILETATALRKVNLIGQVGTHGRNIGSNAINLAVDGLAQYPAVLTDIVVANRLKQPRTVALSSLFNKAVGKKGLVHGWDHFKRALTEGMTDVEAEQMQVTRRHRSGVTWVDSYINKQFNLLNAEDRVFYNLAYHRSLWERAKVQGINEKLSGKALKDRTQELFENPTAEMTLNAGYDADVVIFKRYQLTKEKAGLTEAIQRVRQTENQLAKFAVENTLPFDRTPTNIVTRLVEASPLGFGKAGFELAKLRKQIKAEVEAKMTAEQQRQFAQTVGRATAGTVLYGLGAALYHTGILTAAFGANDEDKDKPPNSLKIGGRWYSLDGWGPQASALLLGATTVAAWRGGKDTDDSLHDIMGQLVKSTAGELPLLEGTTRLAEDFQRKGGMTIAGQMARQMVPFAGSSTTANIATQMDEFTRKPEGFWQGVKEGIPVWRESLPENKRRTVSSPFDPTRSQADRTPQIAPEVRSALRQHRVPFTRTGIERAETPDKSKREDIAAWEARQERALQMFNDRAKLLVSTAIYQKATPEQQKKMLESLKRRIVGFEDGEANKVKPDMKRLDPKTIYQDLKEGEKTDTKKDKTIRRENISVLR